MPTIYDVARQAGVSPKTVSRVLNGDGPVGQDTRARVEATMQRLGYVPSNAARMMRSNRSGLIGLITGAISQSRPAGEPQGLPDLYIVQGVQAVVSSSGKTLMIADTGGEGARVPDLIRTFAQHRVEGLIYVAEHHQQVSFDVAVECPLVLANCYDDAGTAAVLPHDRRGQRELVEQIVASGHRRIGFVTLDPSLAAGRLRLAGYRDALRAADVDFDPELVVTGYPADCDDRVGALGAAIERLLSLAAPPTVICCGNDEMALRLYGLLRTRGLRVPEDVSVAGFDDYRAIAETLFPPLTTVELPYPAIGQVAAHELLAMIGAEKPQPTGPTLVPGPVAWRSSVTAPNSVNQLSRGRSIS